MVTESPLELTGERTLPGLPRENYWFQRHVAAYRFAARLARGAIVDAGSGEGYGAAILSDRGRTVGLDVDAAAVSHAAPRYRSVRFLRADLERLPIAEASVDAIVALQVIEHLARPDVFLASARAALRPNGVLVLSTPNRATFPSGQNPWHTREYEARELHALLSGSFEDVRMLGIRHGPFLAGLDNALGESVQHRLVRRPWAELPAWLRGALRAIGPRAFRIGPDARSALDLIAICRGAEPR